jgi:hypothetical protein
MILSRFYMLLCLTGLTKAWMPTGSPLRCFPFTTHASRFDELVYMDEGTPAVDDRYYSMPPTQPQVLVNSKPRITLTRFLSNIVKENPEVRIVLVLFTKESRAFFCITHVRSRSFFLFARLAIWNLYFCRFKWHARPLVI